MPNILLSVFFLLSYVAVAPTFTTEYADERYGTGACLGPHADNKGITGGVDCNGSGDLDISVTLRTPGVGPAVCLPSQMTRVGITLEVEATAAARYDFGLYIQLDGGNDPTRSTAELIAAMTGPAEDLKCVHKILQPVDSTPGIPGTVRDGNYYDGDNDSCGDVEQNVVSRAVFRGEDDDGLIDLTCVDSNDDGIVDFVICEDWENNMNQDDCFDIDDNFADGIAKCRCQTATLNGLTIAQAFAVLNMETIYVTPPSGEACPQYVDVVTSIADQNFWEKSYTYEASPPESGESGAVFSSLIFALNDPDNTPLDDAIRAGPEPASYIISQSELDESVFVSIACTVDIAGTVTDLYSGPLPYTLEVPATAEGVHPTINCVITNEGCSNECTCDNGSPAVGNAACPVDDAENCVECNEGYQLTGEIEFEKTCEAICSCENGVVTVYDGESDATLCEEPQEDCSSCIDGYHLENSEGDAASAGLGSQTCEVNECTCTNGAATLYCGEDAATLCDTHEAVDCSGCDAGYHLSAAAGEGAQSCDANSCTCANGDATLATGTGATLCEVDDSEDCSACDDGYHESDDFGLGGQQCLANFCTCPGGTATFASGSGTTLCAVDNAIDCYACDLGFNNPDEFSVGQEACEPNVCTCSNGIPSTGTACETDDSEDCNSCAPGYFLNGDTPPTCTICSSVTECSSSVTCTSDSNSQCEACEPGYNLVEDDDADVCDANVCTCANGDATLATGAGTTLCEVDDSEDCSACDDGYHESDDFGLGGQQCLANFCYCPGGTATLASGEDPATLCDTDRIEDCSSCNEGFTASDEFGAGAQQCVSDAAPPPCDNDDDDDDDDDHDGENDGDDEGETTDADDDDDNDDDEDGKHDGDEVGETTEEETTEEETADDDDDGDEVGETTEEETADDDDDGDEGEETTGEEEDNDNEAGEAEGADTADTAAANAGDAAASEEEDAAAQRVEGEEGDAERANSSVEDNSDEGSSSTASTAAGVTAAVGVTGAFAMLIMKVRKSNNNKESSPPIFKSSKRSSVFEERPEGAGHQGIEMVEGCANEVPDLESNLADDMAVLQAEDEVLRTLAV